MSAIQLAFLGPVQFRRSHHLVELNIAKMQAMLAYLALTGTPQRREHLLDLLWAESYPDAARKNLRNSLWRLRRVLGDEVVVSEEETLSLSGAVWTDVAAFEAGLHEDALTRPDPAQLRSILDLWRGPLLANIRLADAPDFEIWLRGEQERLGRLYLRGLGRLLDIQRAATRWDEVITTAQRAIAHDVTQEPMHAALMEAHAWLGRRADALRQFDVLRTALARELGVEPHPTTAALRDRIAGGDWLAQSAVAPAQSSALSSPPRLRTREHPRPFVGREAERHTLDDARRVAASGQLQIALVSGELGIGKSTLWRQWSAQLPAEVTALEARCLESTQSLPFAPLTGLFGGQLCLQRITAPHSPVSPVWLSELTRLIPQLRETRPDLPAIAPLPPDEERRRLFEALVQTLRALDGRPLVLFIDDLHWADQATLDWLAYLADRMRNEALLVVAAYRANEAPPTLAQVIAYWAREGSVWRLPLSPLTVQEAASLIAALDGDVAMADYLHTQSGGNPYYLTELSQVYPDGMPSALVDLVGARLGSLPDPAQRLLQTAAIVEPAISFEMLRTVGRQSEEEETLDALDLLLDMRVLIERGDEYEFAHPLLAAIVREGLSAARRKRLHLQVAEALRALNAGRHDNDLGVIYGQLARHYAEAGEYRQAALCAEQAAANAAQIGAMTEAVNFWRQAIRLEPTPARQLGLGYALMHVPGGVDEARAVMQQALATAEVQQDHEAIVQAGLRLAFSYLSTEEGKHVLHWAQRIAANLEEADSIELRATVAYLMGSGLLHTDDGMVAADDHFREATRLTTRVNGDALASDIAIQSWFGWGNLSVQMGDFAAAQNKFARTLTLAQTAKNIYFEALCYNNLAHAALLAGDVTLARATVDTGLAFVERHGLMRPRQYLFSTRGEVALAQDDLDAAEVWFTRALNEADTYANSAHAVNVRAHLGRVAQERGDHAQAVALLDAAQRSAPREGAQTLRIQLDLWLAEAHLLAGDRPAARSYLAAARQLLSGSPRRALQREAERIAAQLDGN